MLKKVTIIKFQKPLAGNMDGILAYNEDRSVMTFIATDDKIVNDIFPDKDSVKTYCQCEVNNGKITKVIKQITDESDFF